MEAGFILQNIKLPQTISHDWSTEKMWNSLHRLIRS